MATKDLEQITHFDGVMITSGTENGGRFNVNSTLNPPIVISDAQRNTIENTSNKAAPIKKGTLVYNEEANSVQAFQGADAGSWVSLGAGGEAGTVTSVGTTVNGGLVTSIANGAAITAIGTIGLTAAAADTAGTYVFAGNKGGNAGNITMTVNDNGVISSITFTE